MLNGKNAELTIKIAALLAIVLIFAMTAIVIEGKEIPGGFDSALPALIAGVLGFLAGSRVVTPDVSAEIKTQRLSHSEQDALGIPKERQHHAS